MRQPEPAEPTTTPQSIYDDHLAVESHDSRRFYRTFAVALAIHLGILFVTLPQAETQTIEPPPKDVVRLEVTPRFKPPEVPRKREIPPKRALKVPIPDPTPDDPEPIVRDEPEEVFVEVDYDADSLPLAIPEAPPEPPAPTGPVRIGGQIKAPERVFYVHPEYTEMARRARLQGTVVLDATINVDGKVVDIETLRGLPLGLTEAAVAAVRQWRYEPVTLNGKPTPGRLALTVTFALQ